MAPVNESHEWNGNPEHWDAGFGIRELESRSIDTFNQSYRNGRLL